MPRPLKAIILKPVMAQSVPAPPVAARPTLSKPTAAVLFAQPVVPATTPPQPALPPPPPRSACRVLSPPPDAYEAVSIDWQLAAATRGAWSKQEASEARERRYHPVVAPLSAPVVPLGPPESWQDAPIAGLSPLAEQHLAHAARDLRDDLTQRAQHLHQSARTARDHGPPRDWRALCRSAAQCYVEADRQAPEPWGWSWADQAVACYVDAGDIESGCRVLDSLVMRYPSSSKTLLRQARALLLRGNTGAGSHLLTDALQQTNDAEFWRDCADLLGAFDMELETTEVVDLTCDTCCQSHLG